jgi:molybdenum cofactor biosynthesis protein B
VSDTRTEPSDHAGAVARRLLQDAGHRVVDYRIVPDEPERILEVVRAWLRRVDCDAVVIGGGTGVSSRDRTPETVAALLDRRLDGFGELFHFLSYEEVGSTALLSRALGGVASGKPVFALPGSPRAVELALGKLILPALGHLLQELRR